MDGQPQARSLAVPGHSPSALARCSVPAPRAAAAATCPCTIFAATQTPTNAGGQRHRRGRAGREVPGRPGRLRHRHPLLQGRRQHRHPHRLAVEQQPAPGWPPSPSPTRPPPGWQQATFSAPVAVTANTTYVASYYAPNGRYSCDNGYFSADGGEPAADRAAGRHRRRQRRLPLRDRRRLPDQHVPRLQLLGRRGLQRQRHRHHRAHRHRPQPGRRRHRRARPPAPVAATFSEPVQQPVTTPSTPAGGTAVAGATSYDAGTRTATFTPTGALAASTTLHRQPLRGPRHRRQHDGPVTLVLHHRRDGRRLPVHDLADHHGTGHGRRRRLVRRRARRASSGPARRLHHRPPLLQGRRQHRHPRRVAVDAAPAPGSPPSPSPARRARGWQQATFGSPVAVTANTTYVASYYAPVGPLRGQPQLLRRARRRPAAR